MEKYTLQFKLNEYANPLCSQPYPVPKVHEKSFKNEVERLVLLGVFKVANDSECGAPSFVQPKPKSYQVSFISDFRNLNKQLKQKPYPMPKINDMLLK